MNKKLFEMVKEQLATIERCQAAQRDLMVAYDLLTGRQPHDREQRTKDAYTTLQLALWEREGKCWRDAAIFALGLKPEQQREVRQKAYQRYYSDCMSVAHLLGPGHVPPPGVWAGMDEDEIRAALAGLAKEEEDTEK